MPTDPPVTTWQLRAPPLDHPHDLWAAGADLEPGTILAAYRLGLFPMPLAATTIGWWSPAERGIVPLDRFRSTRSLRRDAGRYEIRIDTAFDEVVAACADPRRPNGWIDVNIRVAYGRLYELGWAHSIEGWDDEGLAGGLYCLAMGGLVAGESMFHQRSGASKAAFLALVDLIRAAGDCEWRLFDVQWATANLERLGAVGISRGEYVSRLERALALTDPFGSTLSGPLRVRQIADPGSGTSA